MFDHLKKRYDRHIKVLNSNADIPKDEILSIANNVFSELKIASDCAKILGSLAFYLGLGTWSWNKISFSTPFLLALSCSLVFVVSSGATVFIVSRSIALMVNMQILSERNKPFKYLFVSYFMAIVLSLMFIYAVVNFFQEAHTSLTASK